MTCRSNSTLPALQTLQLRSGRVRLLLAAVLRSVLERLRLTRNKCQPNGLKIVGMDTQILVFDAFAWHASSPSCQETGLADAECLQVALKRAFMTAHHADHKRTVISVLLDLSNFYDRISLEKLAGLKLPGNTCSHGHAGVQRATNPGS